MVWLQVLESVTELLNGLAMNNYFLASAIEEPLNIISILHRFFIDAPWAFVLKEWENIIFAGLIGIFIVIVFRIGMRKRELIPSGFQNFLELFAESLDKGIYGVLGAEGKKYVPFLGTIFVYILLMNLAGLVPLMKAPSSSLNVTIALAVCVFVLVQYLNIKNMGVRGFLYHLAGSPKDFLGWMLAPFLLPIEIITQLSRPLTLSLRLFGNIMGEEALIAYFILMGVYALSYFKIEIPAGIPLQIPFLFLGVLTSVMQAGVFTLLSAVYILLSMPHEEKQHH